MQVSINHIYKLHIKYRFNKINLKKWVNKFQSNYHKTYFFIFTIPISSLNNSNLKFLF